MIGFTKAHACGNDFLILSAGDLNDRGLDDAHFPEITRRLCARTTGVGADGAEFLTVTGERSGRIVLHNADGSRAEISGNGTRCVAAFLAHRNQLQPGDVFSLETDAGVRHCRIEQGEGTSYRISSGMGIPVIEERALRLGDGKELDGAVVNTGNPHFVVFVDDGSFRCAGREWDDTGREVCTHPDFPEQTNVEFVHVLAPSRIEIRIFERGVGPTTSSGTGTTAAAAAAIALRGADRELEVRAPGGAQTVHWPSAQHELLLTGPAELVASGTVLLPLRIGQAR